MIHRALYGTPHQRRRKQLQPFVASGQAVCSGPNGCGLPIEPGEPWDLGHVEGGASVPQHARCNRATAAKPAESGFGRVSRDW